MQFFLPDLQLAHLTRLDRDVTVPRTPVAVDVVTFAAFVDQSNAFQRPVEHPTRVFAPEQRFESALAAAPTEDHLAAVAARCAPADALGFEHHDLVAGFREFQRSGQANVTRTEDADVGVDIALQDGLRR